MLKHVLTKTIETRNTDKIQEIVKLIKDDAWPVYTPAMTWSDDAAIIDPKPTTQGLKVQFLEDERIESVNARRLDLKSKQEELKKRGIITKIK